MRQPRQCEGRHPRHHPRWPVVLVLLVSFATGVSFVVSISCFLGNAGRGTSSQAHDCAIVGIAGVDVCSPPPPPPSPARRHPDSPGRLHSLLLGKTRASSAPVLGWRKRIDPCLSPPLRPRRPPVDDLPRCVILNSSLPRWSPLSLFCFCVSDSMLAAASLLCSSWAAWRSLQAWLASSRFSGGRDGFLIAILSFALCMPSLVST